jgi:hypothetical protein
MDSSLRIRTATRGEAELLLEIQKASSVAGFGHVFPPDKYPFPSEAVLDRWHKAIDDPAEVVVLAELATAAVGFAPCAPSGSTPSTLVPPAGAWASARGSTITH